MKNQYPKSSRNIAPISLVLLARVRRYFVAFAIPLLTLLGSCNSKVSPEVDDTALRNADSDVDNWLTHGRTYSEHRHSPLEQIDESTVDRLGLAWSYEFADKRGLEATPIVVNGVLYTTSSWSVVHAFDAATGEKLWTYNPEVPRGYARFACCDVVNRGPAFYKGKVYSGTLDGRLIAVDSKTGKLVWETQTTPEGKAYTITGAPRIVEGRILIGNGGAEYGVRGYISAYDAENGELAWRTYTVPGDPSLPFESKALEKASKTWSGEWWHLGGGGTCWDAITYDPELQLVYIGTGNGSPWYRRLRSHGGGDNLYLSSIIALRADDGELVWHYQTTPGDNWDYTATQPLILAELTISGAQRKVIMQAPKNGFFYVIDRATGEFISAKAFGNVTWAEGIDTNGRPIESKEARELKDPTFVRPATNGAHNWHPMSFHPGTGLVYFPVYDGAFLHLVDSVQRYYPRDFNTGRNFGYQGPEIAQWETLPISGKLVAWDPIGQKEVWKVEQPLPVSGGVLSTAGNLIFQGRADGDFSAYRATDGQLLWEFNAGTGIGAAPITYRVNGIQYVAVMAGWGGAEVLWNSGFGQGKVGKGRLLIFALDHSSELVMEEEKIIPVPKPDFKLEVSAEELAAGFSSYMTYCGRCHGANAISRGLTPDLRYTTTTTHEVFNKIVLEGVREVLGMPSFGEDLTTKETKSIQAYILGEARKAAAVASDID